MVIPCLDEESGIRVDLIFSLSPYAQQALGRAREVVMGGSTVRFVGLEDLIIHKIVAGRPRDLDDVKSVVLKNPKFDKSYIEYWLREFSQALDQPFDARFNDVLDSIGG